MFLVTRFVPTWASPEAVATLTSIPGQEKECSQRRDFPVVSSPRTFGFEEEARSRSSELKARPA